MPVSYRYHRRVRAWRRPGIGKQFSQHSRTINGATDSKVRLEALTSLLDVLDEVAVDSSALFSVCKLVSACISDNNQKASAAACSAIVKLAETAAVRSQRRVPFLSELCTYAHLACVAPGLGGSCGVRRVYRTACRAQWPCQGGSGRLLRELSETTTPFPGVCSPKPASMPAMVSTRWCHALAPLRLSVASPRT